LKDIKGYRDRAKNSFGLGLSYLQMNIDAVIRIMSQADTLALSFDTGQLGTLGLTDQVKKR
jgi:hypothetical protein